MSTTQIQPWSTVGASMPAIEPLIPIGAAEYYKRSSLMPWQPSISYNQNVQVVPLSRKCVSSYAIDPSGAMTSKPLRFPNLVTGYQRDPVHAAQTALHTRYTPNEWFQKQMRFYNEADANTHYSERIRNDANKIMRAAEEKIQYAQYDTGRRLGERITDVTFWRNEIASELEKLIQECERLQDCRNVLEKTMHDLEGPLHVVEECLYHREARKSTELVHDDCEKSLLHELSNLRNSQKVVEACLTDCKDQLRNCRASQHQLEIDLKNKESTLGIDTLCHQLNNYSHGLQYYSGIEKYDPCVSVQESWADAANRIIQKSQTERTKSCQLRSEAEALVNRVARDMWESWTNTNNALTRRTSELLEAKCHLQQHINRVQQEIFDVEKNLELLRKAIADKSHALKVAHTRLEARMHRPELELCRDYAHLSLQKEIEGINNEVNKMHKALKEMENQHQRLLRSKNALEHDLALKIDAMHIDKEKVFGLRRAYPVNALFRF
ncbi:tektin-3-like isoform X2 [Venturia canescens]|uniref:tektin-3-like isoform X2 n=1 Tax=Venturia canescens TaxID=32260 RepID=UPI001C9D248D|nr:tektin-3-like isoform X2 [Venturia canescens]